MIIINTTFSEFQFPEFYTYSFRFWQNIFATNVFKFLDIRPYIVFFRLLLYNNSFQYTFKNNWQYYKYYLTFSLLISRNLSAFSLSATTGCFRTDLFAFSGRNWFFNTNFNPKSFAGFYNNICLSVKYIFILHNMGKC